MADSGLIDPATGRPISRETIARLRGEVAGPTLTGVRQPFSGHPAEGMTPARLARIHRAAAQGDSLAYMELAEDIEERELHYAAVLGTRKRQVCQLPVSVIAASDAAEHVAHKEFLDGWLKRGVLKRAMFDMLDGIAKGYSVHEIEWETDPGKPIVPGRLIFRPQRWFEVDRDDGETIKLRAETGQLVDPMPWRFVIHRHPSKSGLVMRSGLARLVSWAWMFKSFTMKDWAVFAQNYGQPIRVGRYGPESAPEDRDVLWQAVANIAGDCAAIVPRGMEIEFIQPANVGAAADLYEKRATFMNLEISKAVLGQTTTTDAVSGGHAVAQEHRLVQEDIERSDAEQLATTITQQLFRLIIDLNFGPQEEYPECHIGRPDEIDRKLIIDALDKLGPQGLTVEASQLRDMLGFDEPAPDAELVGGRGTPAAAPGVVPGAAAPGQQPGPVPPALQSQQPRLQVAMLRGVVARMSEQAPDVVAALTDRLAQDAAGALSGMTEAIRAEFEQASDLPDLARRLARMNLDTEAFATAMQRGLALAHLVGQADLLDEIGGRT